MKKLISLLMVAAMLVTMLSSALIVLADEENNAEPQPYFVSFTGTVVEVVRMWEQDAPDNPWQGTAYRIELEDEDGNTFFFNTDDRTVFPFESEIEEGDVITGYVPANAPMIMIYPPQHTPKVIVAGMPDDQNVQVDRFAEWDNENFPFLSYGGMFAFAIGEDTEIVTADGDEFEFFHEPYVELNNRRMVVIYDVSTRSIPELATAIKVIVLFEDAVPLPENGIDIDLDLDVSEMPILVNGEEIQAPSAFMAEDGVTVMVPLRAIAEALGFTVTWHGEDWSVTIDDEIKNIRLVLDEGYYLIEDGVATPVDFEPVPILVVEFTYVPMRFFTEVAGMANAFAFEGQIEFHREGERME
jgi:hypothetical protein